MSGDSSDRHPWLIWSGAFLQTRMALFVARPKLRRRRLWTSALLVFGFGSYGSSVDEQVAWRTQKGLPARSQAA